MYSFPFTFGLLVVCTRCTCTHCTVCGDYQDNKHLEFDSIVSEKPPRDRNIFAFKISNHLKGENIFAIKVHPAENVGGISTVR